LVKIDVLQLTWWVYWTSYDFLFIVFI